MSIEDRDCRREQRLRWDDRRGAMRLEDTEPPRSAARGPWGWIAIGAVLLVVLAAGGGRYGTTRSAFAPGDGAQEVVAPVVTDAVDVDDGPQGPVLVGAVAGVTDGDTIKVVLDSGPITVRLGSIDAPEKSQPWGQEARAALTQRVNGQKVALEVVEQDRYERLVAVVYLGEENVNAWMVKQGHAWVYRQYARDARYCEAEVAARAGKRGVWARPAAEQRAPWEWRRAPRTPRGGFTDYSQATVAECVAALGQKTAPLPPVDAPAEAASNAAPGTCRIKGNVGSNGRIYHLPGSGTYDKTVITASKGERWFCSEDEARAAGWRAPRG